MDSSLAEVLKQNIINVTKDLVGSFLYYDRKEDEDLLRGEIEKAINENIITKEEIVDIFRKGLDQNVD